MFVASVAVGNAFVTHEGKLPVERCPPQGYDSVIGEVRGGNPGATMSGMKVVYPSRLTELI